MRSVDKQMSNSVELHTERFLLRPLTPNDVNERYLSWLDDARAKKYIVASTQTRDIEDLRQYVSARLGRSDVLFLGIFDKANGAHVGNIKFEPINRDSGYAIVGILIGERDYRGKGVTTEALKASSDWLKQHLGIGEILLGVDSDNVAAIRAYEKADFTVGETPHITKIAPGVITMIRST